MQRCFCSFNTTYPQPIAKSRIKTNSSPLNPILALLMDSNIDSLTYTHDDLRSDWFHLDRLLDRMAPFFSIDDSTPPTNGLGALTALPAELIFNILEDLSISDLMRFRRCNRYSTYFVDTIPSLRTVLRIAPNTVKGIVALQVSTHITIKQLCQKLYQRECDGCGELAQCIYLPTCLRACFFCLHPGNKKYFNNPEAEQELRYNYRLDTKDIAARPSFRPLRCTFTNGMNKFKTAERHTLYDCCSLSFPKRQSWEPQYRIPSDSNLPEARSDRAYRMFEQDPKREAVTVIHHDPLHFVLRKHMAAVIAHWPDAIAMTVEQGVFCSACLNTRSQDRIYTRDTFSEHLKDCRVRAGSLPWDFYRRTTGLWLCEDDE
jgi:hypothetical protein